jgi:hypothetical protein
MPSIIVLRQLKQIEYLSYRKTPGVNGNSHHAPPDEKCLRQEQSLDSLFIHLPIAI